MSALIYGKHMQSRAELAEGYEFRSGFIKYRVKARPRFLKPDKTPSLADFEQFPAPAAITNSLSIKKRWFGCWKRQLIDLKIANKSRLAYYYKSKADKKESDEDLEIHNSFAVY
jgi:hypothetical protein